MHVMAILVPLVRSTKCNQFSKDNKKRPGRSRGYHVPLLCSNSCSLSFGSGARLVLSRELALYVQTDCSLIGKIRPGDEAFVYLRVEYTV